MKYKCTNCNKILETEEILYLCPECEPQNSPASPLKGVLETIYEYETISEKFSQIEQNQYVDLLPLNNSFNIPNVSIGNTPIYEYEFGQFDEFATLFVKDETKNPTFSVKDRIAALVSAVAKDYAKDTIVLATDGNLGVSFASVCAAQQQNLIVYVPNFVSENLKTQMKIFGAKLIEVEGDFRKALDLSIVAADTNGWYNGNYVYNSVTIESVKTVAYEIFSQFLGNLPERIFIPVGNGLVVSGLYRGFEDLLKLKFIEKIPIIVAIQPTGANNLIVNIDTEKAEFSKVQTIAKETEVHLPTNFYMAKNYIKKYNGEILEIEEDEISRGTLVFSRMSGILADFSTSLAFGGFMTYFNQDILDNNSKNLILLSGSGYADISQIQELDLL